MRERIFISLGSNLGQRGRNLKSALCAFREKVTLVSISQPLRTPAWGRTDQPDFINLAAEVSTFLEPRELLSFLLEVEENLGRLRLEKWGPRIIDLDILYYGNRVIQGEDLNIPHPWIAQREFVLRPMAAIAPDWTDPQDGHTMQELLDALLKK